MEAASLPQKSSRIYDLNEGVLSPFPEGEQLVYGVYYGNVKIGESITTFHGKKEFQGNKVYYITVSTAIPTFKDVENIYAEEKTFLPLYVSRLINNMGGFTTTIDEHYDQDAGLIEIEKRGKFLSKKITIQKKGIIHNAILLPYYYRLKSNMREGATFKVNLPTLDFDVTLKGKETIVTPMGEYSAYVFKSNPSKFTLWVSADEKRIPLKIENPTLFGYSLIINAIESASTNPSANRE